MLLPHSLYTSFSPSFLCFLSKPTTFYTYTPTSCFISHSLRGWVCYLAVINVGEEWGWRKQDGLASCAQQHYVREPQLIKPLQVCNIGRVRNGGANAKLKCEETTTTTVTCLVNSVWVSSFPFIIFPSSFSFHSLAEQRWSTIPSTQTLFESTSWTTFLRRSRIYALICEWFSLKSCHYWVFSPAVFPHLLWWNLQISVNRGW